jgi:hypothetical protein
MKYYLLQHLTTEVEVSQDPDDHDTGWYAIVGDVMWGPFSSETELLDYVSKEYKGTIFSSDQFEFSSPEPDGTLN